MKIEMIKYPSEDDWMFCKQCTLVTVGKEAVKPPDARWKHRILEARHSPIRTLQFAFKLTDIPYCDSVHLCRHVHAQPFVQSQRNDRQDKYDRRAARQDAPVDMIWYMNAEELMTVLSKRLCGQAARETREIAEQIKQLVEAQLPEFQGLLEAPCVLSKGVCHEMFPCGFAAE
jgi:thymidylate synthase ThyX